MLNEDLITIRRSGNESEPKRPGRGPSAAKIAVD